MSVFCSAVIAYFNGSFIDRAQVAISPDDRGFLFADGIYEVIRSYGGTLFRRDDHLARLETGLRGLRMPEVDIGEISGVLDRLLQENNLATSDALIYLQVTRGSAPRSHRFPPQGTPPTIYVDVKPFTPASLGPAGGAAAILVPDQRWARCDLKTIGLLPNTLAHQRAVEAGAFEALLVRDGAILEGSHTNVFFVRNGALITAPLNNQILPGITRQVVLELANGLGLPLFLRPYFEEELPACEEVFIVGTGNEIMPIVSIDGRAVGPGGLGSITRILQQHFQPLTRKPG
jgi:D-alanine transaminase